MTETPQSVFFTDLMTSDTDNTVSLQVYYRSCLYKHIYLHLRVIMALDLSLVLELHIGGMLAPVPRCQVARRVLLALPIRTIRAGNPFTGAVAIRRLICGV